ncbi:lecithin-cholesterol acyltransferase-like 1 [Lolium rigidum]|uniref:lecithin-cholesterol acyltransferase-like 1 n=1 Tax=Lolium rigidum TaxID=89674 RepID=UPI001F5DCFB6|nr:lecithin-cholesterol acyltransferase-like 1 [Lolium rigidum]
MATKLRWWPRFLLILSLFFRVRQTAALQYTESHQPYAVDHALGVHPVVLLPGNTCSQIEARLTDAYEPPSAFCAARKGDGRWSLLWKNITAPDAEVPCFADQLRLVYDQAAGDYGNAPGVETRAVSFGSTRGFLADDPEPLMSELCMGKLVEALEREGYRDGETLFGASYDFRHAPAPAGQANRELSLFRRRLRALVERASRANGGKPVILVSHSQGGYFALDFLRWSPLPWSRRFVKHFVMASTGAGGFVLSMQGLAASIISSSSSVSSPAPADVLSLPSVGRTFASTFTALPSPIAFRDDTPLVVTRNRSYAARDMPAFLAAAGQPPYSVQLYETRALPVAVNLGAPVVPVTCVNGGGVPTPERLLFRDGRRNAPEVVYGDGDGVVNLASILALDEVIGGDPMQEYYKSVRIANMSHLGVVSDSTALQRLIGEILVATRAVDSRVM